jgi:hypothetical protein
MEHLSAEALTALTLAACVTTGAVTAAKLNVMAINRNLDIALGHCFGSPLSPRVVGNGGLMTAQW